MEIIDARQAFYAWNDECLKQLYRQYDQSQQLAIQVLPVFLQTNSKFLPGYNGADTPAGIYGYKPDNKLINKAKKVNNRFTYQQDGVLKNALIESVFIQSSPLDNKLYLWVIHSPNMKPDQYDELNDKLNRIRLWLANRNIHIYIRLVSAENISTGHFDMGDFTSVASFLDNFYLESVLLAGKYPVWWLVPPEDEIEYDLFVERIKEARFVNENEFLDLGSVIIYTKDDFLSQAVKYVQSIYQSPEIIWFKLLLLNMKQSGWSNFDGLAMRVKRKIYLEQEEFVSLVPDRQVVSALLEELNSTGDGKSSLDRNRLFSLLKRFSRATSGRILDLLTSSQEQVSASTEIANIPKYFGLYRSLFFQVKSVFDCILRRYRAVNVDASNQDVLKRADNLSMFLQEGEQRIPVYNYNPSLNLIQPKILLRHIVDGISKDKWLLVVDQGDGIETIFFEAASLLAVIAWGLLNQMVDISTLVSVDSERRVVRQVDARHALEVLLQKIDPVVIRKIPAEVFNHDNQPLRSIVFISIMHGGVMGNPAEYSNETVGLNESASSSQYQIRCEQLTLNSWGDAYVRQYTGNQGILRCLCDWMNTVPLSAAARPNAFEIFGYAAGDSTYMAQRIMHTYDEMVEFFYSRKKKSGRFIIRTGDEFACFSVLNDVFGFQQIDSQASLLGLLEEPVNGFMLSGFERYALPEIPLREIYALNKQGTIQVFFQVRGQTCMCWVLDESGSLCQFHYKEFNMDDFVRQWLLTIRNIRNHLKIVSYQDRELPKLELTQLSMNQLGGLDFNLVEPGVIKQEVSYIGLHIHVNSILSKQAVTINCEGHAFDYETYGDNVVSQVIRFIKQRHSNLERLSVFITDIDLPVSLLGFEQGFEPQTIHYLKYKRDFEQKFSNL